MQWRLAAPGILLLLGCGVPLAIGDIQADAQQQTQQAADRASSAQLAFSRILPPNPPDVAWALVKLIDEDSPDDACLLFTPTAATQLATTADAPNCQAAIDVLHQQVTDPNTYIAALTVPPDTWSANGDTATLNGCTITWDGVLFGITSATPPGPRPGRLTLTRLDSHGWLITNYQSC